MFIFHDQGVYRAVWNGAGWTEVGNVPAGLLDRGAAGPSGLVAVRLDRVYVWDGSGMAEATQPPDRALHPEPAAGCSAPGIRTEGTLPELGPVAATDGGFIALAARSQADWYTTPLCEPLVWRSADGDTWTPTSDDSPFGERAFVHDLAVVGGRVVVVGGVSTTEAAAWVSDDGGLTWQQAGLRAGQVWKVAGSARGWIALGYRDPNPTGEVAGDMWFSADGLVWDGPYERPPGWGGLIGGWDTGAVGLAMLDDRVVGTGYLFPTPPEGPLHAALVVGVFVDE